MKRVSLLKRLAFSAGIGALTIGVLSSGAHLFTAVAPIVQPRAFEAFMPAERITDGLRSDCVAGGEQCEQYYGAPLPICRTPGCASQVAYITPEGFVGPPGRTVGRARPPGTFRVLALGGSTTGGGGWQCNWPGQLEELLQQRAAAADLTVAIEVLNLGVPAATSGDQLALYRTVGTGFEPNVVVIGEEVNDLGNCAAAHALSDESTGETLHSKLSAFQASSFDRDELAALSPWYARHADRIIAAFRQDRRAAAAGQIRELLVPSVGPEYDELVQACHDARLAPMTDAASMLDDYREGWAFTRSQMELLLDEVATHPGTTAVLTTTPHAFDAWGCPSPTCLIILELGDWRSYLVRVQNPGTRALARERGVMLVDLEKLVDDWTVPQKKERFAEWMHATCEGHGYFATQYADAIWPLVVEASR